MTSRRNPKLGEFVKDVKEQMVRQPVTRRKKTVTVNRENAEAAAAYIDSRLKAASKGGKRAHKRKPGRPITNNGRSAELNRARVRRHRAKKEKVKND
jgi:hypothetical protein